MTPRISFIIPAHNEEQLLAPTLRSIHAAARGLDYEIIVVADACTDATERVALEQGARVERVELRKISAVRNAGARVARGEIFIFVDADTIISRQVVRDVLRELKRGAVAGGAPLVMDGHAPWPGRLAAWIFVKIYVAIRFAAGCFIYARREAFHAAGGFDERYFASEEIHLSLALRCVGPFHMIRTPVRTSSRKLRTHGGLKIPWLFIRFIFRGFAMLQTRDGLDLWYDGKRESGSQ